MRAGGDNEIQRTMLEIFNRLDGFYARRVIFIGSLLSFTFEFLRFDVVLKRKYDRIKKKKIGFT